MITANVKTAYAKVIKASKIWLYNDNLMQNNVLLNELIVQLNLEKKKVQPIQIAVKGSGNTARLKAVRLCLARYLIIHEKLEKQLKAYDSEIFKNKCKRKLPKLPERHGARARRQKSYR